MDRKKQNPQADVTDILQEMIYEYAWEQLEISTIRATSKSKHWIIQGQIKDQFARGTNGKTVINIKFDWLRQKTENGSKPIKLKTFQLKELYKFSLITYPDQPNRFSLEKPAYRNKKNSKNGLFITFIPTGDEQFIKN
ncbi:hypothetical protein KKC17_00440 [Patescibacteria group bacterium]|nr:hypothetical protein [Patescibacteria group bacterium]